MVLRFYRFGVELCCDVIAVLELRDGFRILSLSLSHSVPADCASCNIFSEEGARFPMITMASGVWAGAIPLEAAWNCQEVQPGASSGEREARTVKQELERIGFLGNVPASWTSGQKMAAHFELHIEQGPILENESIGIGVVTGAQAYRWFEIEVQGRDSHAGTTPFSARRDAFLAAAKMIVESNRIAKEESAGGLVTTGMLSAEPGSINTMARVVKFTLDMRHPNDQHLELMVGRCRDAFSRIAQQDCERGVSVQWKLLTANGAVDFHRDCIHAIEKSAEMESLMQSSHTADRPAWKHMISGAGHDSCHVSRRCPTAMIFVPTRDGMSHTPDEYCEADDCVRGAQVLLGAVLNYDAARL